MDFEKILSGFKSKTCVLSVESYADGGYGNIRIVDGNKAHYDDMANTLHHPFVPDSPYAEYFPQNNNFEDFVYRCAIMAQPAHAYVPLMQMGLWLNMFLLPLESDRENIGYCLYSYEVSPDENIDKRTDISADTSAAVLKTCIKLRGAEDTQKVFHEVIEDIRQICGSDHCCILLTDPETRSCMSLCEAHRGAEGWSMENSGFLNDGFYDVVETWDETIGYSTCVIIKDDRDREWLKSVNPLWYDSLQKSGAKTVVLLPLVHNGKTLGYTWAINFDVEKTVKIKETLELTTFFFAAEIANLKLLQKLEVMSSIDALTGVKNRNKMNAMVDDIVAGNIKLQQPYAVIFADLNGLKSINDINGHSEGDRIIRSAAMILQKVFPDSDVFRAGGDEFMLIVQGTEEAQIAEKIEEVRAMVARVKGLSLAIGSFVAEDSNEILQAMRVADQGMYADKKAYYETHQDRRR